MAKRYLGQDDIHKHLHDGDPDSEFDDNSDDDIFVGSESDEDATYVSILNSKSSSDDDSNNVDSTHNSVVASPSMPVADPITNSTPTTSSNVDTSDWADIPDPNPLHFLFEENVGLNIDYRSVEDFVKLFLPDQFLQMLVEQTNTYAAQTINNNGPLKRSSRMKRWIPTDVEEMKLFLGLLLHMGPVSLPSLHLYWSKDVLYQTSFWSSIMSQNRFQLLLRFFHFADNSLGSDDKLYKIRPILNHFNDTMKTIYVPDRDICIDESMLWFGRLSFRQYIKNKKRKYGIKSYNLCESSGLIMKTKICCSREEVTEDCIGHAADVVLHLMDEYFAKGYTLYMDNFYNSVALTDLLSAKQTYVCGTLRNNRKGNPKDVVQKKLKNGEVTWKRKDHITVCKWKDKRDVLTISNMHQVEMKEERNRNGKVSTKPNIVIDYNKGMSGVDRSDQMISYYSALGKTIRWPKKVALHILESMVHNAHILHCRTLSTPVKNLPFREKFVKCLLNEKFRSLTKRPRIEPSLHYLDALPPTEKKTRPTKVCKICTKNKLRRETRYFCPVCEDHPPLCVINCFKIYHEMI